MARSAGPSDTFNPRNRDHVFVDARNPLWLLRGKTVADMGWLVSASRALKGGKAAAQVLAKLQNPYVVRKVREAEPALDYMAKLPATVVIFAALAQDRDQINRLISSVRKDELAFLTSHIRELDVGMGESRQAKADSRAMEAQAREMVAKFRRYAHDGLAGLGRILGEEKRAGMTLAQIKAQARALDDKARVLEEDQFRRAKAIANGKGRTGGQPRIELDLRGQARTKINAFVAVARGADRLIAQTKAEISKINATLKEWRKIAGLPDMGGTNKEFRGWLMFSRPTHVAQVLGVSVSEAEKIIRYDPVGRMVTLQAELRGLQNHMKIAASRQYRAASQELVHKGIEEAYTTRLGGGRKIVDWEGARRAYTRLARTFILPEKDDPSMWVYTGMHIPPATADRLGIEVYTPPGSRVSFAKKRLSEEAYRDVLDFTREQNLKARQSDQYRKNWFSAERSRAYQMSVRGSARTDAGKLVITITADPARASSFRQLGRIAPSATDRGYASPSDYVLAAQSSVRMYRTVREPGPRDPRTETFIKTVTVPGKPGTVTVGHGTMSREWIQRFGVDTRTGLPTMWYEHRQVWSGGTAEVVRPGSPRLALERRQLALPGRPAVRILNRVDTRGLPIYEDEDFKDLPSRLRYRSSPSVSRDQILPAAKQAEQDYRDRVFRSNYGHPNRRYSATAGFGADDLINPRLEEQRQRERALDTDWRRKMNMLLPSFVAGGLLPYDPGFVAGQAFLNFGEGSGNYRALADIKRRSPIQSVGVYASGAIEFQGDDNVHYQVIGKGSSATIRPSYSTITKEGRLVSTLGSPWREFLRLEALAQRVKNPGQLAQVYTEVINSFAPGMAKGLTGREDLAVARAHTEALAQDMHPAVRELFSVLGQKGNMLKARGLDLPGMGEGEESDVNMAAFVLHASARAEWQEQILPNFKRQALMGIQGGVDMNGGELSEEYIASMREKLAGKSLSQARAYLGAQRPLSAFRRLIGG